jgi:glycosyltransferase involved in cell wall biosynthesis
LVYSNCLWTNIGAIAAVRAGIKHVWHIREFIGPDSPANFLAGNKSLTFIKKSTGSIIYNSRAIESYYNRSLGPIPHAVVYNGVITSPATIEPRKIAPPEFLVAGSLRLHKNIGEAIQALALLRQRVPQARLIIAGSDAQSFYQKELQEQIINYGLQSAITMTGFVDNMTPLYKRVTGLVVCSTREPWGRTLVEAMAAGCPVVAAESGGVGEIITHEKTGLLYKAGNAEALAEALHRLCTEASFAQEMVYRANAEVNCRYTVDRYVQEVSAIIDRAANAR